MACGLSCTGTSVFQSSIFCFFGQPFGGLLQPRIGKAVLQEWPAPGYRAWSGFLIACRYSLWKKHDALPEVFDTRAESPTQARLAAQCAMAHPFCIGQVIEVLDAEGVKGMKG